MKQTEHSLLTGFIEAIIFPFKPGVLVYNLMATLILGYFFYLFYLAILTPFENVTQIQSTAENVASDVDSTSKTLSEAEEQLVEETLAMMLQMGASEADIEQAREVFYSNGSMAMSGDVTFTPDAHFNFDNITPLWPLWIIAMCIIGYLVLTKNFDVATQIAEGDFSHNPSFRPNDYVSPFITLKYICTQIFIMMLLMMASMVLGFITSFIVGFGVFILFGFLVWMAFILFTPAIMLTLIRTNQVFASITPSEVLDTIRDYIGWSNYLILVGIYFFIALINSTINATIMEFSAGVFLLITLLVIYYISAHLATANFYMMGFLTQHNSEMSTSFGFSGYEGSARKQERAAEHTDLADAKHCISQGYDNDAITLLKNALERKDASPIDTIKMHQMLISIYERQGDEKSETETIEALFNYVNQFAPSLRQEIGPDLLRAYSLGRFEPHANMVNEIAQLAFDKQSYNQVIKLISTFAKNNPEHPSSFANYLLLAKALSAKKQYEKAYRIVAGLIKKYPEHPQIIEAKSQLSMIKHKYQIQKSAQKSD